MHYCEGCGSYLGGAHTCPACGTPANAPMTWTAQPLGAPQPGPHPLYQSHIPPMPAPRGYGAEGAAGYAPADAPARHVPDDVTAGYAQVGAPADHAPGEEPLDGAGAPDDESTEPPLTADDGDTVLRPSAPHRGARNSRRARRRKGRTAKLLLGITGGAVLVGAIAAVLPGELLPTGSPQHTDTQSAATASPQGPVATEGPAPQPTATATPSRPHTAAPSASTAPATAVHSAVPVSAAKPPAPTQPGTAAPPPPPRSTTQAPSTPAPRPNPTHQPSCFLFWCS